MSYITYQGKRVSFGGNHNLKLPSINTGLVAYWSLDDVSTKMQSSRGNILLELLGDISSNVPGKINKCVKIGGEDQRIFGQGTNITQTLCPGNTDFSISFWINLNELASERTYNLYLYFLAQTAPQYQLLQLMSADNTLTWGIGSTDGSSYYASNTTALQQNQWYHIVCTLGNNLMKIYLNGVDDTESTSPFYGTLTPGRSEGIFSLSYDLVSTYINGYVDEVGVWNKYLTIDDVSILYNNGAGRTFPFVQNRQNLLTDIAAYWKLDETSGITAYDSVNNYDLDKEGSTYIITSGKINNANVFSKINDIIDSSYGASLCSNTSAWSISFWAYLNRLPSAAAHKNILFFTQPGYRLVQIDNTGFYQDKILALCYDDLDTYQQVASDVISSNIWYHIAVVAENGQKLKLYVNNILYESTGNLTSNLKAGMANGHFEFSAGSSNYLEGKIDEAGVWNRALTPTDVSLLYNSGYGRTYPFTDDYTNDPGLIRNGTFDDGSTYWGYGSYFMIANGVATYSGNILTTLVQQPSSMYSLIKGNTWHTLSFDISVNTGICQFTVRPIDGTNWYIPTSTYTTGHHDVDFLSNSYNWSNGIRIQVNQTGAATWSIDNIRLREKY